MEFSGASGVGCSYEMGSGKAGIKARLARREALAKDYQDGQPPNTQNVVLAAKE
jgi:hypothetical protein